MLKISKKLHLAVTSLWVWDSVFTTALRGDSHDDITASPYLIRSIWLLSVLPAAIQNLRKYFSHVLQHRGRRVERVVEKRKQSVTGSLHVIPENSWAEFQNKLNANMTREEEKYQTHDNCAPLGLFFFFCSPRKSKITKNTAGTE